MKTTQKIKAWRYPCQKAVFYRGYHDSQVFDLTPMYKNKQDMIDNCGCKVNHKIQHVEIEVRII